MYLVRLDDLSRPRTPPESGPWTADNFILQAEEVADVKLVPFRDVRAAFEGKSPELVPADLSNGYEKLFDELEAMFP